MKKKRVKKVDEVKQEEVKMEEEGKPEEQPQIRQRRSPWDNLVFMGPRPQLTPQKEVTEVEQKGMTSEEATATIEEVTEEKPAVKGKRQGWSWI